MSLAAFPDAGRITGRERAAVCLAKGGRTMIYLARNRSHFHLGCYLVFRSSRSAILAAQCRHGINSAPGRPVSQNFDGISDLFAAAVPIRDQAGTRTGKPPLGLFPYEADAASGSCFIAGEAFLAAAFFAVFFPAGRPAALRAAFFAVAGAFFAGPLLDFFAAAQRFR